jgi:hypothetical protein
MVAGSFDPLLKSCNSPFEKNSAENLDTDHKLIWINSSIKIVPQSQSVPEH